MSKKIRVSSYPMCVSSKISNSWGIPRRFYTVTPVGYISAELFDKLQQWEAPLHKTSERELDYKERFKLLSNYSRVYQFNADTEKSDGYIRMVSILGGADEGFKTVKVSWFSAFIKRPILQIYCNIMNLFGKDLI